MIYEDDVMKRKHDKHMKSPAEDNDSNGPRHGIELGETTLRARLRKYYN